MINLLSVEFLSVLLWLIGNLKAQRYYSSSRYGYYKRPAARYGLYNPHPLQQHPQVVNPHVSLAQLDNELDPSLYERDWSQWTEWSLCSRSCGGGVSMRTRRCGIRTINDITKECAGKDIQHKTCHTQTCPGGEEDFRNYQCSQFNDRQVFTSAKFKWTAYYGSEVESCQLVCMAIGNNFYKEFGPVQDGTKCHRDRHDICIEGKCLKVGCDKIVGSNLTEDTCGVCGGDNSSCYYYSSILTELPKTAKSFDYHKVVVIPSGSTNIFIKDTSTNYLALKEADGNSLNFVINGNWVISWPGDVMVAGTVVKYVRTDDLETMQIVGPTINDLHVMILYLGGKTFIEYEYWAPNGVRPLRYSELVGEEITRNEEENYDYYDTLYQDWDVLEATKSSTTTSTTTTTTTMTTTTTSTTTQPPKMDKNNKNQKMTRKRNRPDYCTPCKKPSNRKKHFCLSDFVIHVRVLSKNKVEGRRYRHDITVMSVYKSDFHLMTREYLWVYSNCCPKFRPYRQYLIMGRKRKVRIGEDGRGIFQSTANMTNERSTSRYETRLVVDHMDYWRLWKHKYASGMNKFANRINCDGVEDVKPPLALRDPERKVVRRRTRKRRH